MAYFGITSGELKGLYSFETNNMLNKVKEACQEGTVYKESNLENALKTLGVNAPEIKNGSILIKHYNIFNNKVGLFYLSVINTVHKGVYSFKSKSRAELYQRKFSDSVISTNKKEAIDYFVTSVGVVESDVEVLDAIILMRDVNLAGGIQSNPTSSTITKPENLSVEPVKLAETTSVVVTDVVTTAKSLKSVKEEKIKENQIVMPRVEKETNVKSFQEIVNYFKTDFNVLEVIMSNGDKVFITINPLVYLSKKINLEGLVYMNNEGVPTILSEKVENLKKSNAFVMLSKSTYKEEGSYIIVQNADDIYSPDIIDGEDTFSIKHGTDKILLNKSQIATVKGLKGFSDLTFEQITKKSHKLLYDYLVK